MFDKSLVALDKTKDKIISIKEKNDLFEDENEVSMVKKK